jgi:hypothetical protein
MATKVTTPAKIATPFTKCPFCGVLQRTSSICLFGEALDTEYD